jgi:PAS domain-containing protein
MSFCSISTPGRIAMQDQDKTKEQLIMELTGLRSQLAELRASEAKVICEKALNDGKILMECDGQVSRDESGRFKQSQSSQQDIQARHIALFHDVSDGVAVYKAIDNGEDFALVEFNEAAETITGVSGSEAIGKKVSDVFPSVKHMGLSVRLQQVWRTGEPSHHPLCY